MRGLDKFTLQKVIEQINKGISEIKADDGLNETEVALIRSGMRVACLTIKEMARGTERRKRA